MKDHFISFSGCKLLNCSARIAAKIGSSRYVGLIAPDPIVMFFLYASSLSDVVPVLGIAMLALTAVRSNRVVVMVPRTLKFVPKAILPGSRRSYCLGCLSFGAMCLLYRKA